MSLIAAQIRKLIIVSSIGGMSNVQLKTRLKYRSFSRTLQEYVVGIQDDDLLEGVEKYLHAGSLPDAGGTPDMGTTSHYR